VSTPLDGNGALDRIILPSALRHLAIIGINKLFCVSLKSVIYCNLLCLLSKCNGQILLLLLVLRSIFLMLF
jgi:hypothetical protein